MVDLRPCPFCGNNVRLEDREFDDFAGNFFTNTMSVIECKKCGISMKRHPKRGYGITDEQKQDLINSWNRRTELAMLKEQEPEEPIRMHHTEHKQTDNYRCQKCGNDLYFEQRFCEACGCEVKWDG